MEVYLMHKKGVSVVHGTLAPVMDLACYQFFTTLLGIVGYVWFSPLIHSLLGKYIWLLWLEPGLSEVSVLQIIALLFADEGGTADHAVWPAVHCFLPDLLGHCLCTGP